MAVRVLYVDDAADDVDLLVRALAAAGLDSEGERVGGEAALRDALGRAEWDVALVDHDVPGLGGPAALRLIAALAPELPAITVSGAIDEETAVLTLTAGAVDYVLKDNLARLAPAVRRALDGAASRRRERLARQQARRNQLAVENSSHAVMHITRDGRMLYLNPAAEQLGGVPREQAMGRTIWGWTGEIDEDRWAQLWDAAGRGPVTGVEVTIGRRDGHERVVVATLERLDGDDPFMIVDALDVTGQRIAERALRAEEANLAAVFGASPVAMLVLDAQLTVARVNRAALGLLGEPARHLLGHSEDSGVLPGEALGCVHATEDPRGCGSSDSCRLCPLRNALVALTADGSPVQGAEMALDLGRPGGARRVWMRVGAQTLTLNDEPHLVVALDDVSARHDAEDELRLKAGLLDHAEEVAHVGSWRLDVADGTLEWSDEVYRIFGLEPGGGRVRLDEAVAHAVHPDDQAKLRELAERVVRTGAPEPLEYRIVRPNGEVRWVRTEAEVEKDGGGSVTAVLGSVQDVTEHRRTQEELLLLHAAVDGANWAAAIADATGHLIYVNDAMASLHGRTSEDLLGRHLTVFHGEEQLPRFEELYARLQRDGGFTGEEAWHTRRDGSVFPVLVNASLVDRPDGGPPFSSLTMLDISERVRTERELADGRALLEQSQRVASLGHYVLDAATGRWTSSASLDDVFGIGPAFARDVEGWLRIVHPDDRDDMRAYLREHVLREHQDFDRDYRIVRIADGEERWVHGQGSLEFADDGSVVRMFGIIQDVSERHQASQALRSSEERYRALFEESPVAMWEEDYSAVKVRLEELAASGLHDVIGHLHEDPEEYARCIALVRPVDANQAAVELFEAADRADLIARNADLYGDEGPSGAIHFFRAMLEGGRSATYEDRNRSLSGNRIDILETVTVASGHEARFDKVYTCNIDITERKRAEAALAESEQLFAAFAEHMPGELWIRDDQRRYVFANAEVVTHEGKEHETLLGSRPADHPSPEEAALADGLVARALAGETVEHVGPWPAPDGNIVLRRTLFPIPRGSGPTMMGGLAFDVTDEMRAQEAVRLHADRLRRTVEGAVLAMSQLIETRDPYTAGHQRRVADLAVAIGASLDMEYEALAGLRLAALIHDVGKIAVPAEILAKPTRLNEFEHELIRQHARAGYDILASIEFETPVAQTVLQHHERLDGSGYPQGLAGDAILREALIVAVADVVEAMSSHRPYRPALGVDAALAEIREHQTTLYDPEVVTACVDLIERGDFSFED